MKVSIQDINYAVLSPAEKMELADMLYDVAQQELEATHNPLTKEQMQEIERRITAADAGKITGEPWDQIYKKLK